jgi:hypothetical protein
MILSRRQPEESRAFSRSGAGHRACGGQAPLRGGPFAPTQYTDRASLSPTIAARSTRHSEATADESPREAPVSCAYVAVPNSGFAGGWFAAAHHDGWVETLLT